jgi:hypothetical protein
MVLRPSLAVLLLINALVLLLLLANLRTALLQMYRSRQLWRIGILTLGGGVLAPLSLILVGSSPPLLLAAVLLLLLGSLAIRFVIIKVPHALADQSRST